VLAGGDDRKRPLPLEQGVVRVERLGHVGAGRPR
jgi:hypothetical protein